MKILIWVLCFFGYGLITTTLSGAGILLGAIPTMLLLGGTIWLAKVLCKSWDERKKEKQEEKTSEETLVALESTNETLTINENNEDNSSDELVNSLLKFQAVQTIKNMKVNEIEQPDNETDDDFGLVPEKPIYTLALKSVIGEKDYLNNLYTSTGEKITYNRRGSMSAEGVNGMIDIYDTFLPSGELYKTIYMNMYGAYESTKAPNGFVFVDVIDNKQPEYEKEKNNFTVTTKKFVSNNILKNSLISFIISIALIPILIITHTIAEESYLDIDLFYIINDSIAFIVAPIVSLVSLVLFIYNKLQNKTPSIKSLEKQYSQVAKMKEYLDKGIITEEEFNNAKNQILKNKSSSFNETKNNKFCGEKKAEQLKPVKQKESKKAKIGIIILSLFLLISISIIVVLVIDINISDKNSANIISELNNEIQDLEKHTVSDSNTNKNEQIIDYNSLDKNNYSQVTITDLYNSPQKYHRKYVCVSAYNAFYCYDEPTYSENFYDMYLMEYVSNDIDNSESGLGKRWASQFMAYQNLLDKQQPHIIARIYEQNASNALSGSNISSSKNLTDEYVTVYGYFTYNPNTKGYIADPEVFQLEVQAYEFSK